MFSLTKFKSDQGLILERKRFQNGGIFEGKKLKRVIFACVK
jgi:hypothetical protein